MECRWKTDMVDGCKEECRSVLRGWISSEQLERKLREQQ